MSAVQREVESRLADLIDKDPDAVVAALGYVLVSILEEQDADAGDAEDVLPDGAVGDAVLRSAGGDVDVLFSRTVERGLSAAGAFETIMMYALEHAAARQVPVRRLLLVLADGIEEAFEAVRRNDVPARESVVRHVAQMEGLTVGEARVQLEQARRSLARGGAPEPAAPQYSPEITEALISEMALDRGISKDEMRKKIADEGRKHKGGAGKRRKARR